jgi:hypothetical protein
VLRDRAPLLREDFAAPPVDDVFARELVDVFAPVERVEPDVDDFALDELGLRALLERDPELDLRALPPRDELEDEPELLDPSSVVHLPDITRCAASATASAISEPSLVALAITLLAA